MLSLETVIQSSFRCPSCGDGPAPASFPLCGACASFLHRAPQLCPDCGSPACLQSPHTGPCLRPWARHPAIHSYSAEYLLLTPGYRVLKRWKLTGGPLFNRRVLKLSADRTALWREFSPEAVVPVPQRTWRSWEMHGSPSERIAQAVARELGVPVLPLLAPAPRRPGMRRQAELSGEERLSNPIRFQASPHALGGARLILVDDFMTSGRTLREAALTLRSAGSGEVHVFCLGVRLSRQRFESPRAGISERDLELAHDLIERA
ncbi:MAG: hypothetical protein NDJ89_11955 [Oligoflexia bacterium]|nr:hypothetical protein [Oligoflexia bacterium]